MTLTELPEKKKAVIRSLESNALRGRLLEIGFYPNQIVETIGISLFGDPIAVKVGSSTVMLRKAEAENILVEPSEE